MKKYLTRKDNKACDKKITISYKFKKRQKHMRYVYF